MILPQLTNNVAREEGTAYWFLNALCVVKATTETTRGSFSMIYEIAPPGHQSPYHLHHDEDEAFYILDGEFSFVCDGVWTVAGSGDYIFLPRGIPHGIKVSSSGPGTMLILAMPGVGFAGLVQDMAEPARERVLPEPQHIDHHRLAMLCAKYHIDVLGPLPAR